MIGRVLCAASVLLTVAISNAQQLPFSAAEDRVKTFSGDQVLRTTPKTQQQVRQLRNLERNGKYQLDFWKEPYYTNHTVDIRVPKINVHLFKKWLTRRNLEFTVFIADVQRAIDDEIDSVRVRREARNDSDVSDSQFLNSYNSHAEINDWLEKIAAVCGSRCKIHDIGRSGEGRELKVIKIGGLRRRPGNKTAVWIDGGIHAREWISPAAAINFIHKLIMENKTDRCTRHLTEAVDWYILPVFNPDGYEYSRRSNRMWRKNRTPLRLSSRPWWSYYYFGDEQTWSSYCYGVDLNRNFGYYWGETGSSNEECSDVYGGEKPFSEKESVAVKSFLESIGIVRIYLSLHSYGQYWLYSWGYTRQSSPDHQLLDAVASEGARAINRSTRGKISYTVGSAARTLYASSGASDDWAKGSLGVKYSFTIELPPADADVRGNGFILPASAIPGVVKDTWPGIQAMVVKALRLDRTTNHSKHNLCRF